MFVSKSIHKDTENYGYLFNRASGKDFNTLNLEN